MFQLCCCEDGPTVLQEEDMCVLDCARPPCSEAGCHRAEGLSPSPPLAQASSTASRFRFAMQTHETELG